MARKPKGRRPNATGRSEGEESHFRLHKSFAQSVPVRRMTGPELKIWIELHARHNGFNNGRIGLSYGEASKLLGLSKTTVFRAFDGLQEKGFIKLRRSGERLGRLSGEWTLTDIPMDGQNPTREFKDWVPPPKPKRAARPKTRPTKTPREKPALVLIRNDNAV